MQIKHSHKSIYLLLGLLMFVLASLIGRDLFTALANNLAVLAVVRDLPDIQPESGLPQCMPGGARARTNRWIDTAQMLDPAGLMTHLNLGRQAWLEGDCVEAERLFNDVLADSPADFRAAYWAYWLSDASRDPLSLGISPQNLAGFAWQLGNQAQQSAASDAALAWYELSFHLASDQSLAYRILGIYNSAGQVERAFDFLTRMQGRYSEQTPVYWWAAGQIANLQSDWQAASGAFQRAAALAKDPYDFLLDQAGALSRLGDPLGEEWAYRQAIQARPDSYYPYIGLGQLRRRNGDFEAALTLYHQAEALAPGEFLPQYVIGELYYENAQPEQAQAYLEQAVQINPQDGYSNYYLAQIYQQTGAYNLAIDALEWAVKASSETHSEWLVQLGDWRHAFGDLEGALQAYQRAVEGGVTDLAVQEKISRLRSLIGQP